MGQNTQKRPKQEKWIYPKNKYGRGFTVKPINNVNINVYIPDLRTLKTIQFDLTGWVRMNPDMQQQDVEREIFLTKRAIKAYIEFLAKKTKLIKKESIVDIFTGILHGKIRDHQYMTCEVVLYNDALEFNKHVVQAMVEEMCAHIINSIFMERTIFNFIKKNDND